MGPVHGALDHGREVADADPAVRQDLGLPRAGIGGGVAVAVVVVARARVGVLGVGVLGGAVDVVVEVVGVLVLVLVLDGVLVPAGELRRLPLPPLPPAAARS